MTSQIPTFFNILFKAILTALSSQHSPRQAGPKM
jgi:hypothetical protein